MLTSAENCEAKRANLTLLVYYDISYVMSVR